MSEAEVTPDTREVLPSDSGRRVSGPGVSTGPPLPPRRPSPVRRTRPKNLYRNNSRSVPYHPWSHRATSQSSLGVRRTLRHRPATRSGVSTGAPTSGGRTPRRASAVGSTTTASPFGAARRASGPRGDSGGPVSATSLGGRVPGPSPWGERGFTVEPLSPVSVKTRSLD